MIIFALLNNLIYFSSIFIIYNNSNNKDESKFNYNIFLNRIIKNKNNIIINLFKNRYRLRNNIIVCYIS